MPQKWTAEGGTPGAVGDGWLATFNDPQLDELVREALAYNPDLRVAAARVEQAAAYQKVAGATLYPQVNLLARGGGKMSGDSSGLEGVGVFVNWELDLWGRVRAGRAAAESQYVSAALDYHYARQSIAAQVAKSWFLATEARMQKALADETVRRRRRASPASRRIAFASASATSTTSGSRRRTCRPSATPRRTSTTPTSRRCASLETLAGRYPAAVVAVRPSSRRAPAPVPVGMPSRAPRAPPRRRRRRAARRRRVLPHRGSEGGAAAAHLAHRRGDAASRASSSSSRSRTTRYGASAPR